MNLDVLIAGMKFAKEYELTQKEIAVLIPFFEKEYNNLELAGLLNCRKTTLHHTLQRLKLKKLIVLKNRDEKGTNFYEFNKSILEE